MQLNPQFIETLVNEVSTNLYLKKDKAVYQSKIDRAIIKVLDKHGISLRTTDEKGEFVFADYSEKVNKEINRKLKDEGFKIISLEHEKNQESYQKTETRPQQDLFRR